MEIKASRKAEVETLSAVVSNDTTKITERKRGVEEELSGVKPMVDEAKAAVGLLKPANLQEIKAFR